MFKVFYSHKSKFWIGCCSDDRDVLLTFDKSLFPSLSRMKTAFTVYNEGS